MQARIGNTEYALAQSSDVLLTPQEHHYMLSEELRNLHFGEAMRVEFESLAQELNTPLPR